MEDKKKGIKLLVKQEIETKAIVTANFKDRLYQELSQKVEFNTLTIEQIDEEVQRLKEESTRYYQLIAEKEKLLAMNEAESTQKSIIDNLKEGELFSQGTIEGLVSIQVGDNLYEKLSNYEIIVKDGIVQKITKKTT